MDFWFPSCFIILGFKSYIPSVFVGWFLKRFLSGLKPDTTGGIFVRACMQDGKTAFDHAKIEGREDIAVRDRG